jgi:hypothetical protein
MLIGSYKKVVIVGIAVLFISINILPTIVGGTLSASKPFIRGSNAIRFDDVSEECKKTIHTNGTYFNFLFGFILIDAVIALIADKTNVSSICLCMPVEKVTVIGFGSYGSVTDSDVHVRFYVKSFSNVSSLVGVTYKKLEASVEYQLFSLFVLPANSCVFKFN